MQITTAYKLHGVLSWLQINSAEVASKRRMVTAT